MRFKRPFEVKTEEVLCLQTGINKCYEVSFLTSAGCNQYHQECARLAGERLLAGFEVRKLDKENFRVITIHMYNPFVTDCMVEQFLSSYAELLAGPRRLNDTNGFWTGKRQYQVLLKEEQSGFEGFSHPPAYFTLGADRGYLFYSRQPMYCIKCRNHGHTEYTCGTGRCRFCRSQDHASKDCPVPKKCHRCGKEGHLMRDCKEQPRSYAAAAGSAPRAEGDRGEPQPQPQPAPAQQQGEAAGPTAEGPQGAAAEPQREAQTQEATEEPERAPKRQRRSGATGERGALELRESPLSSLRHRSLRSARRTFPPARREWDSSPQQTFRRPWSGGTARLLRRRRKRMNGPVRR